MCSALNVTLTEKGILAEAEPYIDGAVSELVREISENTGASGLRFPEIVLYVDIDYGGRDWRTNLSYSYVGDAWNDQISSFVVVSGVWEFYRDREFGQRLGNGSQQFGPGYYGGLDEVGIPSDQISSFRCVAL